LKLFQIEEPSGGPLDKDAPGAAIGIGLGGGTAEIAVAVGGNAEVLEGAEGFPLSLAVPALEGEGEAWLRLFEAARSLAERALARPVTHAVLALRAAPDKALEERLSEAARGAGLVPLRVLCGLDAAQAAILAEDLAPRPS
jgi:hypothetical protein